MNRLHRRITAFILLTFILTIPLQSVSAKENEELDEATLRKSLYEKIEALTQVPWYYIAAMDQYERNIRKNNDEDRITGVQIPLEKWYGVLPPHSNHQEEESTLALFGGIGKDGNGDGIADPTNDEDVLYTLALEIQQKIAMDHSMESAITAHYEREKATQIITEIAKLFRHFNTIDLSERAFPIPKWNNYSYRSTWGDTRGYGGRRIHEGTDIFASYGTPVRSSAYGVVEIKGWNRFGGWRIGIRDMYNIYHYYAHLNAFAEGIEEGDIVEPGDVIGYVGASGYGPEGTSGKFPPHLHYGMYKDNGKHEWAYDPYPYLKRWERNQ
ncbi:M23 family metallopeptidase [Piscibacillus halophilus]|uniref:Peptidase family M23 n=1 Tax=Piscibacillus halophilus TaxID=571933 RepID=A0A1H9EVY2_9BACI|nr:M23 family metallopeptidase [Piscibacillus halophilus]SEQ29926.1 Peptidase family M23 [Piscibacillus halophilus]